MDHELHQRVVEAVRERLGERAWKEVRDEERANALAMMGFAKLRLNELDRAARTLEEALEGMRDHEDAWAPPTS